jgi:hypothetical protein
MASAKRKRHHSLPVRPVLRLTLSEDESGREAKRLARVDDAFMEQMTPYGTLRKALQVGGQVLYYTCPSAWLFLLSVQSSAFVDLLVRQLPISDGVSRGRLVLYADEVTPGNALRPDRGRTYYAFYWAIMELPNWFLASQEGWSSVMFVPTKTVKLIEGGLSAIMDALMSQLWSSASFNLETLGVRLQSGTRSVESVFLKLSFGCFLGDERALKEIAQVKGSSGIKPCLVCCNVVSRVSPEILGAGFLVHVTECDPLRFSRWTPSTFREACEQVANSWATVSRAKALEQEKMCGILYEGGHGLLWGRNAARVAIPDGIYWDSMHCLWASGGIAQFELAGFLFALREAGLPWSAVSEFKDAFRFAGSKTLRHFHLADRMPDHPGQHLRGFASEMLMVLVMLLAFSRKVLRPVNLLPDHCICLELLQELRCIVAPLDCLPDMIQARRVCQQHQVLCLRLYEGIGRPKLHYIWHVLDCIERHRVVLACFQTERRHKLSKSIGSFCFKSICKSMLTRCTILALERLALPGAMQEYDLLGKVSCLVDFEGALSMRTRIGIVTTGDFVSFTCEATMLVGKVAHCRRQHGRYFLLVMLLLAEGEAATLSTESRLVPADCLLENCATMKVGGEYSVCFSR